MSGGGKCYLGYGLVCQHIVRVGRFLDPVQLELTQLKEKTIFLAFDECHLLHPAYGLLPAPLLVGVHHQFSLPPWVLQPYNVCLFVKLTDGSSHDGAAPYVVF